MWAMPAAAIGTMPPRASRQARDRTSTPAAQPRYSRSFWLRALSHLQERSGACQPAVARAGCCRGAAPAYSPLTATRRAAGPWRPCRRIYRPAVLWVGRHRGRGPGRGPQREPRGPAPQNRGAGSPPAAGSRPADTCRPANVPSRARGRGGREPSRGARAEASQRDAAGAAPAGSVAASGTHIVDLCSLHASPGQGR